MGNSIATCGEDFQSEISELTTDLGDEARREVSDSKMMASNSHIGESPVRDEEPDTLQNPTLLPLTTIPSSLSPRRPGELKLSSQTSIPPSPSTSQPALPTPFSLSVAFVDPRSPYVIRTPLETVARREDLARKQQEQALIQMRSSPAPAHPPKSSSSSPSFFDPRSPTHVRTPLKEDESEKKPTSLPPTSYAPWVINSPIFYKNSSIPNRAVLNLHNGLPFDSPPRINNSRVQVKSLRTKICMSKLQTNLTEEDLEMKDADDAEILPLVMEEEEQNYKENVNCMSKSKEPQSQLRQQSRTGIVLH
jgi:hypothetical protein